MVTYVQIGKNPRVAFNGTVANVRNDFIKQFYTQKWEKLVPIFFYSSSKSTEYVGFLVPNVRKEGGRVWPRLYWITQSEFWSIGVGGRKRAIMFNSESEDIKEAFKLFRNEGYNIY